MDASYVVFGFPSPGVTVILDRDTTTSLPKAKNVYRRTVIWYACGRARGRQTPLQVDEVIFDIHEVLQGDFR